MRLQGDRKGNTIWNFQSAKWKCRQRLEGGGSPPSNYIPEIGDLIFKANAKPFFDLLKLVLLLVSDCAYTVGSANIERSLPLKLNLPTGILLAFKTEHIDLMEGESTVFGLGWCSQANERLYHARVKQIFVTHKHPNGSTMRNERGESTESIKRRSKTWSGLSRLHN